VIAFVTGIVASRAGDHCVLIVGGVGLKLLMSTQSLASLPSEGDEVTVFTHLHVREDEMTLFGFENESEKSAFELLIGVSGVGPKVAMAVLSALSADDLAGAIAREDVTLVTSVPGVGKKTAQRIIIELGDKLGGIAGSATIPGSDSVSDSARTEASDALLAMGFSAAEAAAALKGAAGEEMLDSKALVKHALQRLGGGRAS
jgi:Holliday junction DNA helicase RuvA